MPGSFHGIESTGSAMRAFQRGLDTTGHNISNVNTKGYSRQVADIVTNDPINFVNGNVISVGSGAHVSQINRIRDQFLDSQKISAQSDLGKFDETNRGLSQVQSVFLDAEGKGISNGLDTFFNAWSGLASNPSDPSYKLQVQQAGADVATKIRGSYAALSDLKGQQTERITQTLTQIQGLANKIADLNGQIRQLQAGGGAPNDLMDQRDQAISDLSGLVDVRTNKFTDGTVGVYLDQKTVVDQDGSRPFPTNYDAATNTLSDGNGTYKVSSGSLKGNFDTINAIGSYQTQLDNLANNLRTTINGLHNTGTNGFGNTNVNFFNDVATPPQTGAIDFALDSAVAADPKAIAVGVGSNSSDGSIALAISRARDSKIPALGNQTMGGYFTSLVTKIGGDVQAASNSLSTQQASVNQIEKQISDVSGVSIDDEMANMLKFQRSYQAAAKALSVFDETLQNTIDMLKR